jgi:hypothetical protein
MGSIVYKTLVNDLSLNIDENNLIVSSSKELDMVFFSFKVGDKTCGIALKKEEFKTIAEFINREIGEIL